METSNTPLEFQDDIIIVPDSTPANVEVRGTAVGKLQHMVGVVAARKFVTDYEQSRQWQYELALETYQP